MNGSPAIIAIYDLDRTVTCRPTYSLFLLRSAARIAPLRLILAPVAALMMVAHVLRLFDRDRLKTAMWALLLGRVDGALLDRAIADFTRRTLARNIRPGARRQIAEDAGRGAVLVLATAAHELYARPIAIALGFDSVVATKASIDAEGRVGPALEGGNAYGDSKLAALRDFLLASAGPREALAIRFYSDSSSDMPMFEWVDQPVAVNPSRRLARLAASRGWPVADWGKPERTQKAQE